MLREAAPHPPVWRLARQNPSPKKEVMQGGLGWVLTSQKKKKWDRSEEAEEMTDESKRRAKWVRNRGINVLDG
jgi:23S rRNA G2069 N7-methylase RlmK/C1962 C5-methylase RlmI